jgi:hypothetical protein
MVNVRTDLNLRGQRAQERRERVARPPGIRVLPRDDKVRKYIKHVPTGIGFRETGSVEWPNDRFTQKRLRDGTVTRADEAQKAEPAKAEPAKTKPAASAT